MKKNKKPASGYETAVMYSNINDIFRWQKFGLSELITKNESDTANSVILHNTKIVERKLWQLVWKLTIIIESFHIEARQYHEKESLTEEEKNDNQILWSLKSVLSNIRDSLVQSIGVMKQTDKMLGIYLVPKNKILHKALNYECKKMLERCENVWRTSVQEYLTISAVRSYWVALQGKHETWEEELEPYIAQLDNDIVIDTHYKHVAGLIREILVPYVKKCMEPAKTNTAYKEARLAEWERQNDIKEKRDKEKQEEREAKRHAKDVERLYKFAREKEDGYQKARTIGSTSAPVFSGMANHPDFRNDAAFGGYICVLVREETGPYQILYYTSHGLTNKTQEIDCFFFDEKTRDEMKQKALECENVQCVDTIHVL